LTLRASAAPRVLQSHLELNLPSSSHAWW